jgi:hypothetical protein
MKKIPTDFVSNFDKNHIEKLLDERDEKIKNLADDYNKTDDPDVKAATLYEMDRVKHDYAEMIFELSHSEKFGG